MSESLDTSEAEALPWVKPTQPAPGEEGAPTLTKEETALGAFLAAMHDSHLDGGKMREAMLNVLGLTAAHQPAAINAEQANGREVVAWGWAWRRKEENPWTLVVGKLGDADEMRKFGAEVEILYTTPPAQPARDPISAEAAELGMRFCCGKQERLVHEVNRLRNVIQAACIGGTATMIETWARLFPDELVPTVSEQPAREWVGLTPDERNQCWWGIDHRNAVNAVTAYGINIEAKLREKNAGQPVVKEN